MKSKNAKPNKAVNVLLTSISNKVSLVRSFKDAYRQTGILGRVVGVDSDRFSSGLYLADKGYLVPLTADVRFLREVKRICLKERISLIVPTRDEDLPIFAKNVRDFESMGIKVAVADSDSIAICADKWKLYNFLCKYHIPSVRSWIKESSEIKFPCVVKPRRQRGKGFVVVKSRRQLSEAWFRDCLIQEKIAGTEYTIDYFADFQGRPVKAVPRVRFRVSQGESKVGITKKDPKLVKLAYAVGKALNLVGHNTIQCFKLTNGSVKLLEINPRFGGGAPLCMAAGCNSPAFLLQLLAGQPLKTPRRIVENLVMIRYTQDLFLPYDKIANF